MNASTLLFFLISLTLGTGIGAVAYKWFFVKKSNEETSKTESTVLLESIEKVFKVVMAEGYFTEIYNYENHRNFWNLISDKKKALIIAKAKVLVGYDFGKMRFHFSHSDRKMIIEYFPEPEVLSMDTDYKFYDIEQGWLNRFQTDDYTAILNEAKKTMNEKALQSDLPRIASNQVQLMMFQLAATMSWKIDLLLPEINKKQLDEFSKYRPTDANIDSLKIDDNP
ncbi:hypothetical protein DYBT9275_03521 [Dyadobacter sp. CECT 9275]|uniref:DUF4230 domain-containing protein n=1 Tax=Dyadobacter helix TaxID=2822344 RepID=A0A916NM91_9BACT|nr:DUF4230 domain-containing protein [Dyadobacter sp. CECT 9275]CAG5005138.1 hypothetical protein DYBT9275_03521 [Dyadobacter sp. CECT 9275]